jgi:anaerobic selenocysteine-containing dehydrogenase
MIQAAADRTVRVVCPHDCPDTCSMLVTVRNGRAVTLRGDTDHPFTRGFLCQKVTRYLERVYHPGRLQYPLRRTGPKGAGLFERITWEEAVDTITRRFRDISRSADGPQAILPYSYAGTMGKLQGSSLDRRFFHRLGASLLDRTICATAGAAGCDITLGTRAMLDPETVRHARYIINWGSNTSVTNMHLWTIMHQARKLGARIVTIDPYKCKTAEKSDWWLPIRPGTDAALALGVMHILWRDGLTDEDYMNLYCLGAEELRARVLNDYPPDKVARIAGLDVADVEKLAREYGTIRPAFIRLNYGMQRHGGGGMAVRAITCLPAVIGAWRHRGGGALLSTSKLYPFNGHALERPDLIPKGTRTINMSQLAEALLSELHGPPVRALYVYNSNPAAVCPDQARVLQGLKREDLFTVVHEQFQTDTADYADILLPATTQLENFDIHGSYGHLYVQTSQPAIAPLAEAKSNTDVFRLLAEKMGFEPEIFQVTDEQLAAESLAENAARGAGFQPAEMDVVLKDVITDGVVPEEIEAKSHGRLETGPTYPPPQGFLGISLERLKREGPVRLNVPRDYTPFAEGNFGTPSGKCEFYSETMARMGLDPLPNYTPPHEDPQTRPDLAARFPLQLLSPPAPAFLNSTFVNVDSLRQSAGEPTVLIHPTDAAPRKITTGQWVRVFNGRGSFQAKALVAEMVKPGVLVSQSIWWNRFSPDGVNCNTTTSTKLTDLGGGATFFDNLVEVAKM